MANFNFDNFMNGLDERQKKAVLACRTEADLERVMDDYDIEVPVDMMEMVTGGKGFAAIAMSAILAFTGAGATIATAASTMSVSVSASSASSDFSNMSKTEKKAAMRALSISKDVGLTAMSEFLPGGKLLSPLLNGVLGYFMEVDSGPSISDVQRDIKELREHIDEQYDEMKKSMDSNTKRICETVENSILLGNNGARLSSLSTTIEQQNLLINTKKNENISNEEKLTFIASRIGKSVAWGSDTNMVFKLIQASKALSGEKLMLATGDFKSRDGFMSAYKLACGNAMFSGDAYDMAAPYANCVMNEYIDSLNTVVECLTAAKEVSKFTPEQVAALSPEARKNYDNVCLDADLIDTEIYYLTDMALNADNENSVVSHYTSFMYAKDHDRNVFVDQNGNGDGVVISPTLSVDKMNCNYPKYADYYFYSDFENRFDNVKDETTKAVKDAAGRSEISPAQIEKMRNFAISKGMSFNEYLSSNGINTNYNSNCYFPCLSGNASSIAYSSGDKVAHKGGASDQEMGIYMRSFNASDKNAQTMSIKAYNIKSWNEWRNRIKTEYWSCVLYQSCDNYMLTFQKGTRVSIPKKASEVNSLIH